MTHDTPVFQLWFGVKFWGIIYLTSRRTLAIMIA